MRPLLRKAGLPIAALLLAVFWLLPITAALSLLAVLAVVPAVVVLTGRVPVNIKKGLARHVRFYHFAGILLLVGITLPLWADAFEMRFYSEMLILGLQAMALDVMMGFIGLVSFAHAALAGIASYTVAITLIHLDLHPWVAIGAALVVGTTATTVMGAFSVRVRDIYFGIITLVFGSVFFIIANTWVSVTGGEDGLTIELPKLSLFGLATIDVSAFSDFWYLTFTVVFASYLFLRILMRSPVGLVFRGIRDNEQRTSYLGYNVNVFKILNTAISGFMISLAGVLAVLKDGIIGTEQMDALRSGEIVIWSVVGGVGTLVGPFVGASSVHYLTDYLATYSDRYILIIGLIFVVTILVAPRGIVGTLRDRWNEGLDGGADNGSQGG